jgi:signal peptidase I
MPKTETKRSAPSPAEHRKGFAHASWEWTKSIVVGFLIFLVIRTFLIQTFTIISGSMEKTLLVGDFLVLSKSAMAQPSLDRHAAASPRHPSATSWYSWPSSRSTW